MTRNTAGAFDGKVAFVTGAANGIGRATALAFAQSGASLALVDIDEAENAVTAELVREAGGQALAIHADVVVEAEIKAALDETVRRLGSLDIAFNNVGRDQETKPLAEATEDEWRYILDVNLTSMFLCMRNELPIMLEAGSGVIVNTSSGAGLVGTKGSAMYATAKHAVIGLTRSAALDYADQGIRINALVPGIIETGMMLRVSGGTAHGRAEMIAQEPIGRLGRPEEIASAVLWLASEGASFVVGSSLVVDGGFTA
ncbi:NAD(P)-dependent dehydrogenase (short-subunit alcohol dehydrogenase family) [Kribbella sp. VKM Ac-2527]|uniref:NAD(P)-dependent dehydrogenase (Short-subunit alcohol dehydrogenase family) n=1 Tax=Kribbella caucasensis TaxID=2512215 RepID=A0A4R6KK18_9ACTN|nr:glucose 1-dehydrogenase [Kribbella sp. VKM Ac-2527]TDO51664.1 NAD(P)-dependent dehydrogenase (short-subunit alcohol dehydrogenase family) [Kribbella sp. VKM Ac-2527]